MDQKSKWTSITVERDIHSELEQAKPYESMSFNEFVSVLLDQYEPTEATAPGGADA